MLTACSLGRVEELSRDMLGASPAITVGSRSAGIILVPAAGLIADGSGGLNLATLRATVDQIFAIEWVRSFQDFTAQAAPTALTANALVVLRLAHAGENTPVGRGSASAD